MQRENRDRNSEPVDQLVDQTAFLPTSEISRAQPDENVICLECGKGILERQEGIIGSDSSSRRRSERLDLTQDRSKALVCLLT